MSADCVLCENPDYTFYDVMKHFCSDIVKMNDNLCNRHRNKIRSMAKEFIDKN